MAIKVVPYTPELAPAVDDFNRRMREGGSRWGFYTDPEPDWVPFEEGAQTWREYWLAVEGEDIVRGAYALKPQQWLIDGRTEWLADWQGPFTEADVDVKYSPLMLKLLRSMLKQHPLMFSLGHGGVDSPIVNLLRKMKWDLWPVPFMFYVNNPYRFFRFNKYLRHKSKWRFALDAAAFTGAASVATRVVQRLRGMPDPRAVASVVPEFGDWTDELWARHKDKYSCLAVRDARMMNALIPAQGWPGGTRLRIDDADGNTIGWSVVHHKSLKDDERFGDLTVGLVSDCFAAPVDAQAVVGAAHRYLTSQHVDMIYANMSHPAWINAFSANGYNVLKNRRLFALSPGLTDKLRPAERFKQGVHLTNMDGHGPHGFY